MNDLNSTPRGERLHIGIFGTRNAGKSSLLNAITEQETAVVSPIGGTTTDPVYKAMELLPIGPVVLIDTPGIDDIGELGNLRIGKAKDILRKTDIALLIVDSSVGISDYDKDLIKACIVFAVGAVLSSVGFIHSAAMAFMPTSVFMIGYVIMAAMCIVLHFGKGKWFDAPDDFEYV